MHPQKKIQDIASNVISLEKLIKYAAIIGESPSKGARSPVLWNKAYTSLRHTTRMIPIDVEYHLLNTLLEILSNDLSFIGGAIAVPYKEKIAKWLGKNISSQASAIGAVNCIYRNSDGVLEGTNTDGEAALISVNSFIGNITNKKILILGGGGSGKAVAAYMKTPVEPNGSVFVACRKNMLNDVAIKELGISACIKWEEIDQLISTVDIIINCTTVGSQLSQNQSPLSLEQLMTIQKTCLVFDIIYDPLESLLLKMARSLNLPAINGMRMNVDQAAISFARANFPDHTPTDIELFKHYMLQSESY